MSFRLYIELLKQSLEEFIIYRTRAILTFVIGVAFFLIEMAAGFIFFDSSSFINGWSRLDYFLIISSGSTITSLYQTFFIIAHEGLSDIIIEGELDFALIRPCNSYFYYAINRMDISSLLNAILSVGFQTFFLSKYSLKFVDVLQICWYEMLGVILLFLLNQIVVTFSFWNEGAGSLLGIPEYLTDFSTRPISIYPKGIRFILTYILPLAFVINSPVLILKQDLSFLSSLILYCLIGILSLFSYRLWIMGLKKYVSSN